MRFLQKRFSFIVLITVIGWSTASAQIPTLTSSNLPLIIINTDGQPIVDEPKITASMGIIDNGLGVRNNVTDPFNNYNGKIGIEIRGSSSQSFPKKQYSVEQSFGSQIPIVMFCVKTVGQFQCCRKLSTMN